MDRVVIDASATLSWVFGQDESRAVEAVLENAGDLVAPWIWRLEVVNTVLVRERRKLLTRAQAARVLALLEALGVNIVPEPAHRQLSALADIARPHQLTAYDATYLEVAMNLGLPMLTLDANLRQASRAVGVKTVAVDIRPS